MLTLCVAIMLGALVTGCFETFDGAANLDAATTGIRKATDRIDAKADTIIKTTKEPTSKANAEGIKEDTKGMKEDIAELEKGSADLEKAQARIKELEEKDHAAVRYITYGLIGLGTLLMAVGAVLMFKTGFTQWEVAALGLALVGSSLLTNWLAANFIWFILSIGGIALVGVILWVFLRTDKVAEASVQVGEMLKKRIKNLRIVDDPKGGEQYVNYTDVQAILKDVFGDDTHHGIAGMLQSDQVKANITAKRKKLHGKLKSLYE